MSEECDSKRGLVLLHADQSYGAPGPAYEESEDAWRLYLENPLTAASKAMLSLNGEDGSNPQYFYDYYNNKVPRDKKVGGHIKTEPVDADPNKINFLLPGYPESLLTITPLRNVPLHTVTVQSAGDNKRELECLSYPQSLTSLTAYSAVGGLEVPLHPSSFSSSSAALEDPRHPAAGPSHHGSSRSAEGSRYVRAEGHDYSPGTTTTITATATAKALTAPDSTYTETYKDAPSQILSLPEDNIQLRLSSITPEDYMSSPSSGTSHQFEYIIEAPQSLKPKGSSSMSYLNKGQFYPITLRGPNTEPHQNYTVRSEVMLVFGEEKFTEEQLKHWRFWQSRQHTAKQRCLDIADYKESFSTINNIEEIAYNAVSFTWDSRNEARIFVSVHCLSTDFSPQKGVRGLPLILQVDSYVVGGGAGGGGERRVHRAASQVKVFCDKGAERKIRDEERKQNRRRLKGLDTSNAASGRYLDATVFEPIRDLNSQPVLFIPEQKHCYSSSSSSHRQTGPSDGTEYRVGQKRMLSSGQSAPHSKMSKTEQHTVLLYVRKEKDEVFDALMLRTPTLCGLLDAVSEKFALPTQRIGKVYRRCKNGMLVNMDDNMIRHYSNEDTFLISMDEMNMGGQVLLTLTEI